MIYKTIWMNLKILFCFSCIWLFYNNKEWLAHATGKLKKVRIYGFRNWQSDSTEGKGTKWGEPYIVSAYCMEAPSRPWYVEGNPNKAGESRRLRSVFKAGNDYNFQGRLLERKMLHREKSLKQESANVFCKGHINILVFVGHMISVITTQPIKTWKQAKTIRK